jgi:hypothetical protein
MNSILYTTADDTSMRGYQRRLIGVDNPFSMALKA